MKISVCNLLIIFSLLLTIKLSAQTPLAASVKMYNERPTIFINNQPQYPMLYALTDVPGGRWSWEEVPRYNLQNFCNHDINLIQVDLAFDHVWQADGRIDLTITQKQLRGVLDVCPDAAIFIRFHVNPPKWWQEKYPEENTIYADTTSMPDINWGVQRIIEDDEENPTRTSLASEKWKKEATEKLIEFLNLLQTLPESNALAGIQVAGGVYGEWHYWGFINNEPDVSTPMLSYFRNWLVTKYHTDYNLQQAWHNDTITLSTAPLPTLTERKTTTSGIFRDPTKERNIIDYYKAQHQVIIDDIIHFCKIVKENWSRPIITGAFYGYFYSVFGRETAGGHLELEKLLQSPYIDYLAGPGAYYPSAVETGDPYRSRSLINSITLHQKLWLDEMDQQPPLLPLKYKNYKENLDKSIANTRRNLLFTYTKGQGLWFYDFGPSGFNGGERLKDHGTFGWWDEPSLIADIQQLKNIMDENLQAPYQSDADVLLVHSTETFYYTGSNKKQSYMGHQANNWIPSAIYKSGVVHDMIELSDLDKINLSQYKVIVFINTWMMSATQRTFIQNQVATDGRHLVWIYAPGYCDGNQLNKEWIESLIGMKLQILPQKRKTTLRINSSIIPKYHFSLDTNMVNPLFIVKDRSTDHLGKINNKVGFARKSFEHYTSWFMALPPTKPELWRAIFTKAGAHIYNDSKDIFYSGGGILSVHTAKGGKRTVYLKNGKPVLIDFPDNSTILLDTKTGVIILK